MTYDLTKPAADVFEAAGTRRSIRAYKRDPVPIETVLLRHELGISDDYVIVCGMAMGYADPDDIVNTFQPPRIELDDYAVFCDS